MEFDRPIPVSAFIQLLNTQLTDLRAKVIGEISQLKKWSSGHVYFDIKDSTDESVLSCVIWKQIYSVMGIELQEGMQVVVTGHPNVYNKTGRLSFIAKSVEYAGEGDLKKAYEQLKAKLDAEGIFAQERKRPIPLFTHKVGVITSRQGAVIHDFQNNLGRWGFKLFFVDSRVEGKEALEDLINAMYTMRKQDIEALVIMRGGGSRASLAAFDTEAMVRAIANFPVPVIAGIGHHEDVPLCVLAADAAVSTPTAAAHLLSKGWEELLYRIEKYENQIFRTYEYHLDSSAQLLEQYSSTVLRRYEERLRHITQQLTHMEKVIAVNDPLRQLKLGYSLVRKNGKIVRSTEHVTIGDEIETQVADGTFRSKVSK